MTGVQTCALPILQGGKVWVSRDDGRWVLGVTDAAASRLGEVSDVELADTDSSIERGDVVATLEGDRVRGTLVGAVVVVVLLAAGAGLAYASSFIGQQVRDQLAEQSITMPTADDYGKLAAADQAALKPFAGKPMTTGAQAEAFANHYIRAHMDAMANGKTYEEISSEYLALSDSAKATKDGNKYTISGTATGVDMANPMQPVTKPFEIEVTCP